MRAILTWHSIDPSGSPISVAPEVFRRQVAWLASGRTRVVAVDELFALAPATDAVALTFDDGFANFETEAAPLLLAHGLPATVFVVTAHVGRDNQWRGAADGVPVLPLMDWATIGRLRASGISFGAHTRTHPRLPSISASALDDELARAAEEMRHELGERPAGLAYPYGAFDTRVVSATAAEYRWACTTEFRTFGAAERPHELPRLDAWYFRDDRLLAAWGTARFGAWVWARRQGRSARSLARTAMRTIGGRLGGTQ